MPVPDDGLVEVRLLAPQIYGHQPDVPGTKAVGDIESHLGSDKIRNLAEGSTLWLVYEHQITSDDPSTTEVNEAQYEAPVLKAYVVKSSGGGYQALYACKHTEKNGMLEVNAADASTTESPLYLKHDQVYRFRMISPALPISKSDMSMHVDNGVSFCASDQRYSQTASVDQRIEAEQSGVNYVQLNPMVQQMARLRFNLEKGANVSTLNMMSDGVEISGIQNPYIHSSSGTRYNWSSMAASDSLVMRKGDKRAWVALPGESFTTDASGNLSGDICILPTDARSNTVTILLNLAVNGVPTQYITTLNGQVFEHAKSYNMNFRVSLSNNIVVVNWQNIAWTDDLDI